MSSLAVPLGQYVEEEWLHIEVESLVLQKQLGHEAQMLAVDLVFLPVYLKKRERLMSIDLIPGRMAPGTDFLCGERNK